MSKYMFSEEFLNEVVEFYKAHTAKETSAKFNISKKVVERIIRNAKIPLHELYIKRFINEEDRQFILKNYEILSDSAIARKLHIHIPRLLKIYDELNLSPKTHKTNVLLGQKLQKQTCVEKYGVPFACQNETIKEKSIKAAKDSREKNGELIKQKTQETCLKKYGVKSTLQVKEFREKGKKTCLDKYGADNYMKTSEFREKGKRYLKEHQEELSEKRKKTSLERYGCERPSQNKEVKEKTKQTNFEKYGGWYSQTAERKERILLKKEKIREKYEKTCLIKYGKGNYFDTDDFKSKLYITKKKNNSFNSSKIEKIFLNEIINIFGDEDIKYQYKENRYPFSCDFYIKSLDMFIELNIHWSHGGMPFDKTNEKCLQKLEMWQEKANKSDYYRLSIITWTKRDVEKIRCIKQNKLNYFLIYSYEQIDNSLKKLIELKKNPKKKIAMCFI